MTHFTGFKYDEISPSKLVHSKDKTYNAKDGDVAGFFNESTGYWHVKCGGRSFLVHRVIWAILNGPIPDGLEIDHIDGDRSNNSISNLRCVTRAINMRNKPMLECNKTGFTGVSEMFSQGRHYYIARWKDGDRTVNKCFRVIKGLEKDTFEKAVSARKQAIEELNKAGAEYSERHGIERK